MRYHSVGHCFGLWEKLDIVYQSHIGATNRVSALMPIEYICPSVMSLLRGAPFCWAGQD